MNVYVVVKTENDWLGSYDSVMLASVDKQRCIDWVNGRNQGSRVSYDIKEFDAEGNETYEYIA